MKSDVIQYDRTYNLLKSKIECGILPVGSRLPGRSVLCREFSTSERTIRRALELLQQDGYLEITPRKRPVVISAFAAPQSRALQSAKKADAAQVNDLLETSILLCYPVYRQGLQLCTGGDWHTPETLLRQMDPEQPETFWQLSARLWRFFIARNENELLLRTVDSLGFRGKEPPPGTPEERKQYCVHVKKLFSTLKSGGEPEPAELEKIFSHYRLLAQRAGEFQFHQISPVSPMLAEADGLDNQLSMAWERYSTVCLDLLGLIALGRYQPGDRLPTHNQLLEMYGVSRDTTVKAIRMLRDWGVVTTAPRRGICVMMNLKELQEIQITPEAIACHVRRYLDSLELLTLTVEKVAAHAAAYVDQEAAARLLDTLLRQREQPFEHPLIPRTLLDFITEHIQYDALRSIYGMLARNFSIGRGIPKLVSADKNPRNLGIYQQCIEAAGLLINGGRLPFARTVGELFAQIRRLIIAECKRLGYWDAAMKVYNGVSLWK